MSASTVPGCEPGDRTRGEVPRTPAPRRPLAGHDAATCAHHDAVLGMRRDLHDKIGSALTGMIVMVEVLERLIGLDTARAHRSLADLRSDMVDLLNEVRRLATDRDTPAGRGPSTALRTMLGRMSRAVVDRLKITTDIDPELDAVPEDVAWAAFWIVREAVTNVLKHSTARHCSVSLSVRDDQVHLRVEDDGTGIAASRPGTGAGMANMTWRAEEQGGWCTVDPLRPRGVVVSAGLPVHGRRPRDRASLPGREAS